MERKLGHLLPMEYRDKISGVYVEPEKKYGIYLPDWDSVSHALHTFSISEYQSSAPLTKEETIFEQEHRSRGNRPRKAYRSYSKEDLTNYINFYGDSAFSENIDGTLTKIKDHFESGKKSKLLGSQIPEVGGVWQIYQRQDDNKFSMGGRTFYKTDVTVEALRSENNVSENPDIQLHRYKEPYLLNIYSSLNYENPEQILMNEIGAEQAALPRRMQVRYLQEGPTPLIDKKEVAERLNDTLQIKGKKISNLSLAASVNHGVAFAAIDGFALKMKTFREPRMFDVHQPMGLEFVIADPTLESRAYGTTNLIPPEKRKAAQALTEKVASAFTD